MDRTYTNDGNIFLGSRSDITTIRLLKLPDHEEIREEEVEGITWLHLCALNKDNQVVPVMVDSQFILAHGADGFLRANELKYFLRGKDPVYYALAEPYGSIEDGRIKQLQMVNKCKHPTCWNNPHEGVEKTYNEECVWAHGRTGMCGLDLHVMFSGYKESDPTIFVGGWDDCVSVHKHNGEDYMIMYALGAPYPNEFMIKVSSVFAKGGKSLISPEEIEKKIKLLQHRREHLSFRVKICDRPFYRRFKGMEMVEIERAEIIHRCYNECDIMMSGECFNDLLL